jgi:two-component system, LytTR family, sensor kinase
MKEFINKNVNFTRVEFWAATTIFIFAVFFLITNALGNDWTSARGTSGNTRVPFDYYFISKLIRYTILYIAFLLLNFIIVPRLIRKEALSLNILLIILILLVMGLAFGTTNTYLKYILLPNYQASQGTHISLIQSSFLYAAWLLLLMGFYSVIKYASLYLLTHAETIQSRYKFIAPGSLAAFVLWMITMFLLLAANAEDEISAIWGIVIPFAILFYSYSFHFLIPKSLNKKKPFRSYLGKTILVLIVAFLPVFVLGALLTNSEDDGTAIGLFNSVVQLLIIMPLTWVLYKRQMRGNEEIYSLKKELGQSNANFDFLRSQINPHFLFNALNTIYGTAIQEKAERTSEGVEKLGDMMRFMLQENMQEKISLSREIDYLNNYISLQKLRTDANPDIKIQAEIEQQVSMIQIAPMLLIPFVENAFKHGISFREPSYITITLEVRDHTLYFDVCNSKHAKSENDPEQFNNGVGLNNVQQRLQLLYPKKHELVVRETKKDFFVHLTLELS